MNKQIEEIAKLITQYEDCGNCRDCKFQKCCWEKECAECIYNAGYRRQEDVAREIIAEIESIHEEGVGMIVWMENFFKKIAKLKQKYGVQDDK